MSEVKAPSTPVATEKPTASDRTKEKRVTKDGAEYLERKMSDGSTFRVRVDVDPRFATPQGRRRRS